MPVEDELTRMIDVLKWRGGERRSEPDEVAEETLVTFHVEPLGILDIIMAPAGLQEFIVGHLFCEGLVGGASDVLDVTVADRGDRLECLVELDAEGVQARGGPARSPDGTRRGLIQTECGAPPAWPWRPLTPIKGHLGIPAKALVGIPSAVKDRSDLFLRTGAYHYAFLIDVGGNVVHDALDIGRHTAVDKVVGVALLAGTRLAESALFTTGRISSDIASKGVRAGIPLVASRSAPLTGAVSIAAQNDLGMVGFLRGGRFNVYSGEHHILFD